MADKPKHRLRPRDTNALAKLIVDIATGEEDDVPTDRKNPKLQEAGRKGGLKGGALGEATKTVPFLMDADKSYTFEIRFGRKQAGHPRVAPQGRLTGAGLENRVVAGICERDGLGTVAREDFFDSVRTERIEIHDKLSPIHRALNVLRVT